MINKKTGFKTAQLEPFSVGPSYSISVPSPFGRAAWLRGRACAKGGRDQAFFHPPLTHELRQVVQHVEVRRDQERDRKKAVHLVRDLRSHTIAIGNYTTTVGIFS